MNTDNSQDDQQNDAQHDPSDNAGDNAGDDISHSELESVSNLLAETTITCPYCWESIDIVIDRSVEQSTYAEDCQVCCQPIEISFSSSGGHLDVQVDREND